MKSAKFVDYFLHVYCNLYGLVMEFVKSSTLSSVACRHCSTLQGEILLQKCNVPNGQSVSNQSISRAQREAYQEGLPGNFGQCA